MTAKKKKGIVCFLLPGRLSRPVGGHKIIYQHANYLAEHGFSVMIANNIFAPSNSNFVKEALRKVFACLRFVYRRITGNDTCKKWFALNDAIEVRHVWSFGSTSLPEADYYVATDATTSPYLLRIPVKRENKFYFIQSFENWCMTEEQLRKTYHIPCNIMVISNWLKSIMDAEQVPCALIPNGYDSSEFVLTTPPEQRNGKHLSMLYHQDKRKNVELGLKALAIVQKQIPDIKVSLFGVYDCPKNLPGYITYFKTPDKATHNSINNTASIYIGTSSVEGWGLTVLEAMACGQAVACTDNAGYLEMARHGENALVSPVNNEEKMAENIIRLIKNDQERIRLAKNGINTASHYTIDKSSRLFADCILNPSGNPC